MRIPSWLIVAAAVLTALPFGWGLGVFIAYLEAGPDFGQLPAVTVPLAIIASIAFALVPVFSPITRFAVMGGGSVLFLVLSEVTG